MESVASPIGLNRLTFREFVNAADLEARLTLDGETVRRLKLISGRGWVSWQCAGRQVQVIETPSNTGVTQLYGHDGMTLPGNTAELGLTFR